MTDRTPAYQQLDWDSEFFGFNVSKITQRILNKEQLIEILAALKLQRCALAYWQTSESVRSDLEQYILRQGGLLVDLKTTFIYDLNELPIQDQYNATKIVPYDSSMPESEMVSLAVQSGLYSRFAVDPRIPNDKFESLYTTWILRSVSREIADEVLVYYDGERICGMITLGTKNGRGDIGLVAVDENSRGKKIGVKLVEAAKQWFKIHGYATSQVVTQGQNLAACRLYEKCGYHIETADPYYHIWL